MKTLNRYWVEITGNDDGYVEYASTEKEVLDNRITAPFKIQLLEENVPVYFVIIHASKTDYEFKGMPLYKGFMNKEEIKRNLDYLHFVLNNDKQITSIDELK